MQRGPTPLDQLDTEALIRRVETTHRDCVALIAEGSLCYAWSALAQHRSAREHLEARLEPTSSAQQTLSELTHHTELRNQLLADDVTVRSQIARSAILMWHQQRAEEITRSDFDALDLLDAHPDAHDTALEHVIANTAHNLNERTRRKTAHIIDMHRTILERAATGHDIVFVHRNPTHMTSQLLWALCERYEPLAERGELSAHLIPRGFADHVDNRPGHTKVESCDAQTVKLEHTELALGLWDTAANIKDAYELAGLIDERNPN